jgi:hypothetical protein
MHHVSLAHHRCHLQPAGPVQPRYQPRQPVLCLQPSPATSGHRQRCSGADHHPRRAQGAVLTQHQQRGSRRQLPATGNAQYGAARLRLRLRLHRSPATQPTPQRIPPAPSSLSWTAPPVLPSPPPATPPLARLRPRSLSADSRSACTPSPASTAETSTTPAASASPPPRPSPSSQAGTNSVALVDQQQPAAVHPCDSHCAGHVEHGRHSHRQRQLLRQRHHRAHRFGQPQLQRRGHAPAL